MDVLMSEVTHVETSEQKLLATFIFDIEECNLQLFHVGFGQPENPFYGLLCQISWTLAVKIEI